MSIDADAHGVCGRCRRADLGLSYGSCGLLCCDKCLSTDRDLLRRDERLRQRSNDACLECPHGEDSKVCIDCLRSGP